jgi:hypothetical protein
MKCRVTSNLFTLSDPQRGRQLARQAGFNLEEDLGGQHYFLSSKSRTRQNQSPSSIARFFFRLSPFIKTRLVAVVHSAGGVEWYVCEKGQTLTVDEGQLSVFLQVATDPVNPRDGLLTPVDELFNFEEDEHGNENRRFVRHP